MATDTFSTRARADASIARAQAAGLNALYPLVWIGGQAWFRSGICPLAGSVTPDFDPLGYLLAEARARGMEVYPWFISGRTGSYPPHSAPGQHPEWLVKSTQPMLEEWFDLSRPDVRRFQTDVMIDLLRRYAVDGLHLDYIRFSSQVWCCCDYCREEFARQYGLPPMDADESGFPVRLVMLGNPLAEPTTAQVLACFEDREPAITLNRLGLGEVAVVNWQLARFSNSALRDAVAAVLRRFGAAEGSLYQLRTSRTAAKYGLGGQERALEWFRKQGFAGQAIDETQLREVPPSATLLLYAQYTVDADSAVGLRRFVEAGGRCLFVEGPVNSMDLPDLQQLTGLRRPGQFFYGLRAVAPTADQDILSSRYPVDLELERLRIRKWIEYRNNSVTELVRSVYLEAKEVRPDAQISAAVFHNRVEAEDVCQDWYGWLDEGIVDCVIPMQYTTDNAALEESLREWQAADPDMRRIVPGLAVYATREGKDVPRASDLVVSQVELCRSHGVPGVQFFSLPFLSDEIATALTSGPFGEAVAPRQLGR